ncbi:MAG TPA: FAD-dependent monooxygenase, partial [Hyphomicrobiales bacterium]|nr:FAD-dependent monooxygenase [Hyphomicrobiales bacterium]
AGLNAICTGPAPGANGIDHRTTAFLHGSIRFLDETLDVWKNLAPFAAPLTTLRLIDRTGRLFRAPDMMFSASETGEESFGSNIPNAKVTAELLEALGDHFIPSDGVVALQDESGGKAVVLRLADGRELHARLVVGADGRESFCRQSQNIPVRRWSYDQAALVCDLRHDHPHNNACTEFHFKNGPLTLVPLPGHSSSLVWVKTPERANELKAMSDSDFIAALTAQVGRVNGTIISAGPRAVFPLSGLIATKLTGHRLALIGEAAHVMPPIGAQGLNLGFRDIIDLAECIRNAADPGAPEVLASYASRRKADVWTRTCAADLLSRTLTSNLPLFQLARGIGLTILSIPGPIRRAAMRQGMSAINL